MKEYLRMSDVFPVEIYTDDESGSLIVDDDGVILESFSGDKVADYTLHAISSHDEIVSKLDVAESTIYEVERVLSEMQRNGAFGLDDVIAEVECCIKRLSQ